MAGKLYLIRHAVPRIAAGICYGATDIAADAAASAHLAASLATRLPAGAPLYCSPLQRCRQLAHPLAAVMGVEPVVDVRLAEMDFGAWEMQAWDAIPRTQIDAWTADLVHYRPGGGESVLQAATRAAGFLADVRALDAPEVIAVCHAGSMRLLQALVQGGGQGRHAGLVPGLGAELAPAPAATLTPAQAALRAASAPHPIAYGELLVLSLPGQGRTGYTPPLAG